LRTSSTRLRSCSRAITEACEGITVEAFEQAVQQFFATVTHPTLGLPYTKVSYRPMRELLALLEAHDFTTYICSGEDATSCVPSPGRCAPSHESG
jgi:hypothetical protein